MRSLTFLGFYNMTYQPKNIKMRYPQWLAWQNRKDSAEAFKDYMDYNYQ